MEVLILIVGSIALGLYDTANKSLKSVLIIILFSQVLFGEDKSDISGVYIGIDIGNTKVKHQVTAIDNSNSHFSSKGDGDAHTYKIGYQINNHNRLYAYNHTVRCKGDADFNIAGFGYDYLFGNDNLKPFAGILIGYGNYNDDTKRVVTITGNIFGIQGGINYDYDFLEGFSSELGYKTLISNMEGIFSEKNNLDYKIEISDIRTWYIGFNYRF